MKHHLKSLLLSVAVLAALIAYTQQPLPCGNGKIIDSAFSQALLFERSAQRTQQVDYLVRVYFHVFHDDDGTQGAATLAQINSEFASLLASYAANNICFLNAGIDSFNSTALNRNFNADTDPNGTALAAFQVPGCINIFYMRAINGTNNACNPPCGYGGIALGGIPGTFCLVSTGSIGPGNTIGHEVGHCLGLLHTFETANGFENINGSNSSTAADMITDTPADPFAYNGNACYSVNATGCAYTGNCKDQNNAQNFSPPYNNLMAYWWSSPGVAGICATNPVATNGQFIRVRSFINTNPALINCSSPADLTILPVTVTSGHYMKSGINMLTTNGNVILNSSVTATLGGGTVRLLSGFRASPNADGLVRIISKPCD